MSAIEMKILLIDPTPELEDAYLNDTGWLPYETWDALNTKYLDDRGERGEYIMTNYPEY